MPEGPSNVEIAHDLHERGTHEGTARRPERLLEIGEAILLALVAIATAYSGYQSARWDARSAHSYATSSKYRVESTQQTTTGGQQLLFDATTFNAWLAAHADGKRRIAGLYVERFSPAYHVAFDAWLKLHPFHNPSVPPAPREMPQYHNPYFERAAAFDDGASSRETGDRFVRITVLLAMVLFLTAISQRFAVRAVRIGLMVVGGLILGAALAQVVTYPHL